MSLLKTLDVRTIAKKITQMTILRPTRSWVVVFKYLFESLPPRLSGDNKTLEGPSSWSLGIPVKYTLLVRGLESSASLKNIMHNRKVNNNYLDSAYITDKHYNSRENPTNNSNKKLAIVKYEFNNKLHCSYLTSPRRLQQRRILFYSNNGGHGLRRRYFSYSSHLPRQVWKTKLPQE